VTSNLARTIQIARSWPKRAWWSKPHWRAPKLNVLKILTFKFFDIKILPTLFANPAPSKPFRGCGGRGVSRIYAIVPKPGTPSRKLFHEEIHSTKKMVQSEAGSRLPIPPDEAYDPPAVNSPK